MKAIPDIVPAKDKMEWGTSPILQLLKVAWGSKHEISNEFSPQVRSESMLYVVVLLFD